MSFPLDIKVDIKGIIKTVASAPIYFSIFVLGSFIIIFSLGHKDSYIFIGFITVFYAAIAISIRLFYKDIRDYGYKQVPPSWLYIGYHIAQLIIMGIWIFITLSIFLIK